MWICACLLMPVLFPGLAKGALQAVAVNRTFPGRAPDRGGKKPFRRSMRLPKIAQQLKGPFRQWNVAVLFSLAAMNVNDHPATIDVGDAKLNSFHQSQSAAIDRRQADAVNGNANFAQDSMDFLPA